MSLIIGTGTNIGNHQDNLRLAEKLLKEHFSLISKSRYYKSKAVDYTEQDDFINQVLEFKLPDMTCKDALDIALGIENRMGRTRDIKWGPRIIDIDIIFWSTEVIEDENIQVPHPRWKERSFIVRPLMEIPFYTIISTQFKIPNEFETEAEPIDFLKDGR